MVRQILAGSRYMIVFAVLGSFLASLSLLVFGLLTVLEIVWDMVREHDPGTTGAKYYAIEFIEMIDIFLLGTVLYIVALGLYELFIDQSLPMPAWLHISNLDDLKEKLIGVIVVLLAVTFLGDVVGGTVVGTDVLRLGLSIAAVILALSVLRWIDKRAKP